MNQFVDTDVLIEVLRGKNSAKRWFAENRSGQFAVPGIVAMEIINGSRDKNDLNRNKQFLTRLQIVWPDETEMQVAYGLIVRYGLAISFGIPDAIIAAMSLNRNYDLLTFNLKHYRHIEGLTLFAPFER